MGGSAPLTHEIDIPGGAPLATGAPPAEEVGQTLLVSWLAHLSDTTRVAYMRDLGRFAAWGGFPKRVPEALDRFFALDAKTRNYKAAQYKNVMAQKLASVTCNRRLATLRSLVKKAVELGLLDAPLTVSNMPKPEKLPVDIKSEHYWKLLDHLEQARSAAPPGSPAEARVLRDLALIRLLHDRALRRKEAGTLDYVDVNIKERHVVIWPKGPRDSRAVRELAGAAWEALQDWMEVRGSAPGRLFGLKDLSSINKIVSRRAREAGIPAGIHPHLFRRAGARAGLDAGGVARGQALTGHKDPAMLLYYAKRKEERTADLVEEIGKRPEHRGRLEETDSDNDED